MGEVPRPAQNIATFTLAESITSQYQALADLQRFGLEPQPQVALQVVEQGLFPLGVELFSLELSPSRLPRPACCQCNRTCHS